MVKNITIVIFWLLAISLSAQTPITILQADMAKANDTVRYSNAAAGNFDFTTTGANMTWDFSTLIPNFQDVERFYNPNSTSYLLYFNSLNTTYGTRDKMPGISIGGFSAASFENVMGFYKSSTSALVMVGRGATYQSLPIGINLNPKDTIYKFPIAYGNHDSCVFKGSASLATIGSLSQTGKRISTVDGWGKIITPMGTYDCVRVKSVITEVDSISISALSLPIPNSRTEYKWLTKSGKIPVLEVVVPKTQLGGMSTTVKFKDINRPYLFASNASFLALPTTAAINRDTITFTNNCPGNPTAYQWTFSPNTVTFVGGTSATSAAPRVLLNATGAYTVKLHVTYEGGQDDSIRINYLNGTSASGIASEMETKPSFVLYPVPVKDELSIRSNLSFKNTHLNFYDIMGKSIDITELKISNDFEIHLSTESLKPGIYFVHAITNGEKQVLKFLVEAR